MVTKRFLAHASKIIAINQFFQLLYEKLQKKLKFLVLTAQRVDIPIIVDESD
jgi:hypothetical protein